LKYKNIKILKYYLKYYLKYWNIKILKYWNINILFKILIKNLLKFKNQLKDKT